MPQDDSESEKGGQDGRNTAAWIAVGGVIAAAVITGIFALVIAREGASATVTTSPAAPTVAVSAVATSQSPTTVSNLVTLPSLGVKTVAYSFDGKYLAAGNADGIIRVWQTSTWRVAASMTDPGSRGVTMVAFNRTNSLLAAGDANGHVYVWAGGHATVLKNPSGVPIQSIAFSQDNEYLAAGDASGMIDVWQTSTWRLVSSMTDPGGSGVNSVAFNPSSSLLVTGDADGRIYIWADGHATVLNDPFGAAVRSVVFAADDRALVSGNSAGYVYVWHVGSGAEAWLTTLSPSDYEIAETLHDPDTKGIESIAFNASTTTIAVADGNGRVYLWLYNLLGQLQYPTSDAVLSVTYSPDYGHLAIASADGYVYVRPVSS
jgi:WD40 repeat protein